MLGPIKGVQKSIAINMGLDELMMQTMEESAELIQALNKYRRVHGAGQPVAVGKANKSECLVAKYRIMEELVDVQICMKELEYLLDIEEVDMDSLEIDKVSRTLGRYRDAGAPVDVHDYEVYEKCKRDARLRFRVKHGELELQEDENAVR